MLSKLRVQHYKSLFDTEITLEPLTVFIGPNGSGKSSICEALHVASDFLKKIIEWKPGKPNFIFELFSEEVLQCSILDPSKILQAKIWQGNLDYFAFDVSTLPSGDRISSGNKELAPSLSIKLDFLEGLCLINSSGKIIVSKRQCKDIRNALIENKIRDSSIYNSLYKVDVYDFSASALSDAYVSVDSMSRTGQGLAYSLVDILLENRQGFDELEERLSQLIPNVKKILLPRGEQQNFSLELVDKYSDHHIPASDISDGTLRILAFLTALYQEKTPSIICFEEPENGVHPWLLHKMVEFLKIVSTEGMSGKPVQVLVTTHSPTLLNYVEPHQVRAVELDKEGKTQVHALPTDSARFRKSLDVFDGNLGELWFTNQLGGNPA